MRFVILPILAIAGTALAGLPEYGTPTPSSSDPVSAVPAYSTPAISFIPVYPHWTQTCTGGRASDPPYPIPIYPTGHPTGYMTGDPTGYPTGYPTSYPTGYPTGSYRNLTGTHAPLRPPPSSPSAPPPPPISSVPATGGVSALQVGLSSSLVGMIAAWIL